MGKSGAARWIPARKGFNNFGDLLGPLIVDRMKQRLMLGRAVAKQPRLLAVGSIMRLGHPGDVVWGSGINGKTVDTAQFPIMDVRAVRGPLSAQVLREFGNTVPDVFGDPALLIPHLWSDDELGIERGASGLVLMPNYNDIRDWPSESVDPRGDVWDRVRTLASATHVVASSLHALVIAEAYGVPATLVASGKEKRFKYEDYYEGTGRTAPPFASNWREGIDMTPPPSLNWDPAPLLEAFPSDLWRSRASR